MIFIVVAFISMIVIIADAILRVWR
jgi:hypothetical protein